MLSNLLQLRLLQVVPFFTLLIIYHICCNDLNIYKKNELESPFIEIVNQKKSNIIVGVIYRHPSMNLTDFNCNYLNKLLENIYKEQKSIFLLGGFNVNLLNYYEHNQKNEFLDSLASNSFIPLILEQTHSVIQGQSPPPLTFPTPGSPRS